MSTRKITLESGDGLLLENGSDFLIKDGVAQASDDVLVRMGPWVSNTDHSGLVAPVFTSGGGGSTNPPGAYYYTMMQEWFEAA